MGHLLAHLVEPGFLSSAPVHVAVVVGGLSAVVSAVVGVFAVMRGQSFAGHALGDVSTTGGSGAFLVGANPLLGFIVLGVLGAGAMDLLGVRRARGRDVATGIVLGSMLGVAALFLHLGTVVRATTGATQSILFGSLWAVDRSMEPVIALLAAVACGAVALLYRPLLLGSVSPDLAAARGVPVRSIGVVFLAAMALAVALSCVTIGTILSTALLVGPAATALRLTRHPGAAMAAAAGIGVGATWLSVLLAYDSFYWPPTGHGWPVSFFVVVVIFALYLLSGTARLPGTARLSAGERRGPAQPDATDRGS